MLPVALSSCSVFEMATSQLSLQTFCSVSQYPAPGSVSIWENRSRVRLGFLSPPPPPPVSLASRPRETPVFLSSAQNPEASAAFSVPK